MTEPTRAPIGLRHVALVAAVVVVVVLGLQLVSQSIRPLDDALGYVPLVIGLLVAVTVFVLYRALRPRR